MTRKAIVIAVEGLGTNFVGAYGGSISNTPHLNEMAARSLTVDQYWLDCLALPQLYRSLWLGRHAAESNQVDSDQFLAEILASHERSSLLVTDYDPLIDHEGARGFSHSMTVNHENSSTAEDWHQTELAKLFEQAFGTWSDADSPASLLWIHSRGLMNVWDAPFAWRQRLCDEGDAEPPTAIEPPAFPIVAATDPDVVFGWMQSAAAQVMVLDHVWSWVESVVDELGLANDCMIVLMGMGGYPLGEHGQVGCALPDLYTERLHVPLIIQPGREMPVGQRWSSLVQPASLWSTVLQWLLPDNSAVQTQISSRRNIQSLHRCTAPLRPRQWPRHAQTALAVDNQQTFIRTPTWSARWSFPDRHAFEHESIKLAEASVELAETSVELAETSVELVEVFVSPEDRWQQNDIASLVPDIVNHLTQARDELLGWYRDHEPTTELPNLDHSLVDQVR